MEAQDSKPVPDATVEEREDIEMQQIIMSPSDSLVLEVSEEEKTKENDKPKDIALDSKTEVESHCLSGFEEEISQRYGLSCAMLAKGKEIVESHCFSGSEEEILQRYAYACAMLAKEKEIVEMPVSSEESSSGTNIATSSKNHDGSQTSASGSSSAPSLSPIKFPENVKFFPIFSQDNVEFSKLFSSLNRAITIMNISEAKDCALNFRLLYSNTSTSNSEKDEVQNVDSAQDLSNTRDESNVASTEPPKCESSETSSASLTNEDSITLSNCTEAESSDEVNNVKREEGISSDISQLAADSKNSVNAVSAEMTENETEGHVSTTQPLRQELLENNG